MKKILSAFAFVFCVLLLAPGSCPAAFAAEGSEKAADVTAEMLAAYVAGCDGADTLPAMTAVAAVILNRCADPRCPDTVTANGASLGILPSPAPGGLEIYAARLALGGADPTGGALRILSAGDGSEESADAVTFSAGSLRFAK